MIKGKALLTSHGFYKLGQDYVVKPGDIIVRHEEDYQSLVRDWIARIEEAHVWCDTDTGVIFGKLVSAYNAGLKSDKDEFWRHIKSPHANEPGLTIHHPKVFPSGRAIQLNKVFSEPLPLP